MTLRLCDTQWPNSGLFLQNGLVEYIGVYSDTNYNTVWPIPEIENFQILDAHAPRKAQDNETAVWMQVYWKGAPTLKPTPATQVCITHNTPPWLTPA